MRFKIIEKIKRRLGASHKALPLIIGACAALAVFSLLMAGNIHFGRLADFFKKTDPYHKRIVLFYSNECDHCLKVEDFIKSNKVQDKVDFMRLDIENNSENRNILSDRVQRCGLNESHQGVPFVWDGPRQQCIVGEFDVINFFRVRIGKKPLK